ncbi:MAG: EAL domain-containing protein [Actinobacteria bacterium]|nr:EAL domain-containing protein [Actinomycetota bacterium]
MRGPRAGPSSLLVARQPILDRATRVVAYELLARRTLTDTTWSPRAGDSRTTTRVIGQAFLEMDIWSLTEGLPAFINFTRQLLLDGGAETLPADLTVVEILETITPDAAVEAACRRLRAAGYRIALDDVTAADARLALLGVVDIVKVDIATTTVAERRALVAQCRAAGVQTLAEKVETPTQRDEVASMGFDLFQGYFFQKPSIVGARQRHGSRLGHLQLLGSVMADPIDRDAIGNLLARDRYAARRFQAVAAATTGGAGRSETVRQTLDRTDDARLVTAITVLVVLWLADHHPSALRDTALLRARFCEQLVTDLVDGDGARADDGYLVGLCSLLDALLGEPLGDILARIQLRRPLLAACVDEDGTLGAVLALVRAYEHGQWADVQRHATRLGVAPERLTPRYLECVRWVRGLLRQIDDGQTPA